MIPSYGPELGGRHVYVAGTGDGKIAVFARDLSTGDLSFVQTVSEWFAFTNHLGRLRRRIDAWSLSR